MIQAPSFVVRFVLASAAVHVSVAVALSNGSGRGTDLGAPGQTTEIYTVETLEAPVVEPPQKPELPVEPPPAIPLPNVAIPAKHPPAMVTTPDTVARGNPAAPRGTGAAQGDAPVVPEAPAVSASPDAPARFVMSFGAATTAAGGGSSGAGSSGGSSLSGGGALDASQTFSESGVSSPARLRKGRPPEYPTDARSDGVEGDVPLEIVVDASGTVVSARGLAHAGHGLDEAAIAAVRGYTFTPAQRDGRSVRVRMRWVVQFRLE